MTFDIENTTGSVIQLPLQLSVGALSSIRISATDLYTFFLNDNDFRTNVDNGDLDVKYTSDSSIVPIPKPFGTHFDNDKTFGTTIFEKTFILNNTIGISLTESVNNWNPEGLTDCNILHAKTTRDINITGIQAPNPKMKRVLLFANLGSYRVTFTDNDPLSLRDNRFLIGREYTVTTSLGCIFVYDSGSSRWRIYAKTY